jgi:hypothetical protein
VRFHIPFQILELLEYFKSSIHTLFINNLIGKNQTKPKIFKQNGKVKLLLEPGSTGDILSLKKV